MLNKVTFLWKLLSFHIKMILAWSLWGSVLLRRELRKYAKKSSFENFESSLYSTSVNRPLIYSSQNTTNFFTHVLYHTIQNGMPSSAWIGATPTSLARLDSIQNRAKRVIGLPSNEYEDHRIQPLSHHRAVGAATLFYLMLSTKRPLSWYVS